MRKSHRSQYKQNKPIELCIASLPPERQPDWPASIKIPQLIISTGCVCLYFTAARIWKCLTAKQKQMKATLAGIAKADGGVVRQGRPPQHYVISANEVYPAFEIDLKN